MIRGANPVHHSQLRISMPDICQHRAKQMLYEGRSINKLQNSAIPLILKIGKIRNIHFVGNLILNIHKNLFDDDVITVTLSLHRTQSVCVLFSPPVFYHNSQVRNGTGTRKKRISLTS